MPAHHGEDARTRRDDELVSAYIRLWGDVVDYGKQHRDARVIVRLLDDIRARRIEIEEAEQRDGPLSVDKLRHAEEQLEHRLGGLNSVEDVHVKHLCRVAESARTAIVNQYHVYLEAKRNEEAEELGEELDNADEAVDALKEGMEGNLPIPEPAHASQTSPPPPTTKRKRDRTPRRTAYEARKAHKMNSGLRHVQSAASLSSASGAENALAKSHSRLGYRQMLRYFGVGY